MNAAVLVDEQARWDPATSASKVAGGKARIENQDRGTQNGMGRGRCRQVRR